MLLVRLLSVELASNASLTFDRRQGELSVGEDLQRRSKVGNAILQAENGRRLFPFPSYRFGRNGFMGPLP